MNGEPKRTGVSGGIAALVALVALLIGLASGLLLGTAAGYIVAVSTSDDVGRVAPGPEALRGESDAGGAGRATGPVPDERDSEEQGPPSLRADRPTEGNSDEESGSDGSDGTERGLSRSYPGPEAGSGRERTPDDTQAPADDSQGTGSGAEGGTDEQELQPFIGVLVQDASAPDADRPAEGESTDAAQPGAVVVMVEPDTPAEAAGLERGDLIVAANDTPIDGAQDLVDFVSGSEVGDVVTLTVVRSGAETSIEVVIGGRSTAMEELPPLSPAPNMRIVPLDPEDAEIQDLLDRLPPEIRQMYEEMLESIEEMEESQPQPQPQPQTLESGVLLRQGRLAS